MGHTIILNSSHRPSRHTKENKLTQIKQEAAALKTSVTENLIENAEDQNQASTIVEYASAFDLQRKASKETRILYIRELHNIYGKKNTHTITEDELKGSLTKYSIDIVYPPKIECSESELITEFKSLWPVITKFWLQFKSTKPVANRIKRFWMKMIGEYAIEYPNICQLVILLLSISPGTGPVERSFSQLAKICYKDRNSMKPDTMENVYLLAAMRINEDDDDFTKHVRDYMQK